jgi:4-aminobutyrate--pyruvate transaminase
MTQATTLTPAAKRDLAYHLHPSTNLRQVETEGPLVIARGEGVYVFDEHGNRYLEGMAGLWCASLGFSERRLAEAAHRQMLELPFYHAFAGRVPAIATELAEKLISIAPGGLARAIFANSGYAAHGERCGSQAPRRSGATDGRMRRRLRDAGIPGSSAT